MMTRDSQIPLFRNETPKHSTDFSAVSPMQPFPKGQPVLAHGSAKASFRTRTFFEMVVNHPHRAYLSAESGETLETLQPKDLLTSGPVSSEGKHTVEEHLQFTAGSQGLSPEVPLLVLGMRNSLMNPRCIVVLEGQPCAVAPEVPKNSRRPYYGVCFEKNEFRMAALSGFRSAELLPKFFCSGVPVLWDDLAPDELFGLILTEASDHSHVFNLPRGNHPNPTKETRSVWEKLHRVFLEELHSDAATAEQRLRETIESVGPLHREDDYLHSVIGIDQQGNLVNIIANGRLEELGRLAAARGCRRAICVENSGSISPTFFRTGYEDQGLPLLRAPNFRPRGRVFLIIELPSRMFGTLSTEP